MDGLELQKLRDLPIEEVAGRLGLRVTPNHKARCPFHDDHKPSLSFNLRRNTFRCFSCGAKGNTIGLVKQCLHTDFLGAIQWLDPQEPRHCGQDPQSRPPSSLDSVDCINVATARHNEQVPSALAPPQLPESAMTVAGCDSTPKGFDAKRYEWIFQNPVLSDAAKHFLFDERRINPSVVRWCRLSSWRDRQGNDWLQIPYYDSAGNLIGMQSRRLDSLPSENAEFGIGNAKLENTGVDPSCDSVNSALRIPHSAFIPRFRFPAGSCCSIYNLQVLDRLKDDDELWITEGCSDCWAMLSSGRRAIAIPSATLLTQQDKELLRLLCGLNGGPDRHLTFHMYPDQDLPGERLFLQLKEVIPTLVHHQLPKGCKDYSEYYLSFST